MITKKIEPAKVVSLVREGKTYEEIKNSLGIRTVAQVNTLYMEGLIKEGIISPIKSSKISRKHNEKVIGKNGSLTLSSNILIKKFGFKKGDKFQVVKDGENIVLQRI